MNSSSKPVCRIVRPGNTYSGKQGLDYFEGIAAETVGSEGICMHLLTIPPGARAKAHLHASHETAIYALSGETHCWFGEKLEEHVIVREGEVLHSGRRPASSRQSQRQARDSHHSANRSKRAGKRRPVAGAGAIRSALSKP